MPDNAVPGQVGPGTYMDGFATNRALSEPGNLYLARLFGNGNLLWNLSIWYAQGKVIGNTHAAPRCRTSTDGM